MSSTEPTMIDRPSQTPVAAYDYWHQRWAEYMGRDHTQDIIEAGLVGLAVTERAPDVPDGTGYFTYRFVEDGRGLVFLEGQGDAICEYDSYDLGFRVFADASCDPAKYFADGSIRIVKGEEHWARIGAFIGPMREALFRALDDTDQKFNIKMPRYSR